MGRARTKHVTALRFVHDGILLFRPVSNAINVLSVVLLLLLVGQNPIAAQDPSMTSPVLDSPTMTTASMQHHSNVYHPQQHQHEQNDNEEDECMGMYMAMFMDGFHWTSTACLTFFVSSWKLSQTDAGACLFSFLLAILMESLMAARSFLLRRLPDRYGLFMVLYLVQATLGYLLMLVAMAFSVPLIVSLVCGLMVGNYIFSMPRRVEPNALSRRDGPVVSADGRVAPDNASSVGSVTLRRRG